MKAWRLQDRATLLTLTLDPPAATTVREVWVGIGVPQGDGDIPMAEGLRSPVPTTIRTRFADDLIAGRYLRLADGRLYHLDSARDPDGRRRSLLLTATQLQGEPATYTPVEGNPYTLRASALRTLAVQGEYGQVTEYRRGVEVPWIEMAAAPRRGDTLTVGGRTYTVTGPAADDGIILQLLVR